MQTTNKTKTVFFNANDGAVDVHINSNIVGEASTAFALMMLLRKHNVSKNDTMLCSSSIDFASEEGFSTDSCAHLIIERAVARLL